MSFNVFLVKHKMEIHHFFFLSVSIKGLTSFSHFKVKKKKGMGVGRKEISVKPGRTAN